MTPNISILPQTSIVNRDHIWRAIIHDGPGHHGTGMTKAEALINAANAWMVYERKHRTCDESREVMPNEQGETVV